MTTLDAGLRKFEATEANLEKLDKLWDQILSHIPGGPAFGSPPEYDHLCLAFRGILPALPAIDGFRVEDRLHDYDAVGQMRLDALEVGEIEAQISVEHAVEEQGKLLREYRFKLNSKRRELVRDRMVALIDEVDELLRGLGLGAKGKEINEYVSESGWPSLKEAITEIDTLLGSETRPPRWGLLQRHLHFGMFGDLLDIQKFDWPAIKQGLQSALYGQHDPVPVDVTDLSDIVAARPTGPVTTKLNWAVLSDEDFERLMFVLISATPGYENPEWLQQTHAPDRGRDLSVMKVDSDLLAGVRRHRIIIQCKHWLSRSVSASDVSNTRSQMELWQPPRVDGLVIATTGRFTADAVSLAELHNQADRALHISMWPDSHLERLLAARPHLIAQFRLRQTT
jgi:hypothetical protein